ncbi:hypothetical protein JB92DRAFT_2831998 [Gautieria morchelliformis]|nr:hypothetical protein JB92DRAFT_2831998 [Gautieria morchelliformis]
MNRRLGYNQDGTTTQHLSKRGTGQALSLNEFNENFRTSPSGLAEKELRDRKFPLARNMPKRDAGVSVNDTLNPDDDLYGSGIDGHATADGLRLPNCWGFLAWMVLSSARPPQSVTAKTPPGRKHAAVNPVYELVFAPSTASRGTYAQVMVRKGANLYYLIIPLLDACSKRTHAYPCPVPRMSP